MKDFNQLSGPWTGMSVQNNIRITEAIRLTISNGTIIGTGTDKDGDFELAGSYSSRDHEVRITRRYTHTTEPSQAGVGLPYDYAGKWDGEMVSGTWQSRNNQHLPWMRGPFEMWPDREEDQQERRIELAELVLT